MARLYLIAMMLWFVVGCGAVTATIPTPAPAAAQPPPSSTGRNAAAPPSGGLAQADPGLNLLVAVDGEVALKRRNWRDYYAVELGTVLGRGDLLRLVGDASALVLCDGLTTWRVPAGAPAGLSNGCPAPPEAVLLRGESLVGNTRGAMDDGIPYIISPRRSKVLGATPILRWNPAAGATSYTVSVRGGDLAWTATTAATSVIYPGNPPLQPGVTYALLVEADTGASSRDEGAPGLGFTMLTGAESAAVEAVAGRLTTLGLAPEAKALALAQFYHAQGLYAEAVESLEALAQQGVVSAPLAQQLGDLYLQSGLAVVAGEHYASAITMAEGNGNLEALAAAQAGIAQVHIALGDRAAAIELMEAALDGYETLGDIEEVIVLQAQIDALRR